MPDHSAREAPHEVVRVPAEDEAKVRDPCLGQCPDPLKALLRRADECDRPDEFLVEDLQVLLRELQEVVLIEARVIPVRVDVVPLHPALEALQTTCQGHGRLAAQTTSVDPVAEGGTDGRANGHPRLKRVCSLSRAKNIYVVEEDGSETLRGE